MKPEDKSSEEEGEESFEEEIKIVKKKKNGVPKTFWGKLWQAFLDNFDLSTKEFSSDSEGEEHKVGNNKRKEK